MANNDKSAVKPAEKTSKLNSASFKEDAIKVVDCIVQCAAGIFFVATSYGYVSDWLKTHQAHHDLSVAGGIMVVSIALYLFTRRKR